MPSATERRPTPEELLRRVESEEQYQSRGRLKVFLGYASGVGKSFKMIDEGRRRKDRGQDVIVGAIQDNLPGDVQKALDGMEVLPLKDLNGRKVMDIPSILARKPQVCLVDGLAYDNAPESEHPKRWEDVDSLLSAGISVITSVNLGHIAEKRTEVEAITGKHVQQTVPLSFVAQADEIVIVDVPAESCMIAGNGRKLTQTQLSELREIALLLAADVVDEQLERYLSRHGIKQLWGTQERILIVLSPNADGKRMIESAARNRDRFHGELIAVDPLRPEWTPDQRGRIAEFTNLARTRNAEIVPLPNANVESVLDFAKDRGITQIYVGRKSKESWKERAFGSDLDELIGKAEGIDVRVFPYA